MNSAVGEVESLKNSSLFSGLGEPQLVAIAGKLQRRVYQPGTVVVREGAPGDAMFIIREGEVEVKKREPSIGIDLTIATLRDGACFGEMALLTGRPRTATVITAQTTEVYVLEKKDFQQLLGDSPSISASLNRVLAVRIEEMNAQKGLGLISLQKLNLQADLLALLPQQFIMEYKLLPIAFSRSTLTLAMVNPNNLLAFDEVRKFVKGVAIEPVIITEEDFKAFMKNTYPSLVKKDDGRPIVSKDAFLAPDSTTDLMRDLELIEETDEGIGANDLEREAGDAPIIRLGNNIIALALKKKASDIHLEPGDKGLRVRYRVDGLLREEQVLPKKVLLPLVSRFKIISRLDITERRVPQDGRISLKVEDRTIDFRVSTIPSKYGEKIVIRILDKEAQVFGLDKLITHDATLALVRQMVKKPYGIIYVTGPTGSGKTTTLYSALAELNSPDVNISTAEDPIEYDLPGINQVQVNHDIGLDFARVLRAFLRQDPDIILVGETRDKETGKIAVEAALTGHLVFTTLHTNDAPSTFIRLNEMGIEPFLVSTSIIGIIAQRLVRKICVKCREPYTADGVVSRYLGLPVGTTIFKGKGCDACNLSGYRGRIGVYEVLTANEELRHLIAQGAATQEIRNKAVSTGMKTLKDYCMILLEEGLTTVDEVLRTVAIDS